MEGNLKGILLILDVVKENLKKINLSFIGNWMKNSELA
jgi:hypothetical protein